MFNDTQKRVFETRDSSQLVLGVRGSGKTTLLIQKIISLLSQGVSKNEILILTSSNAEPIINAVFDETGEFISSQLYSSVFVDNKSFSYEESLYLIHSFICERNISYPKFSSLSIAKEMLDIIIQLENKEITPQNFHNYEFEGVAKSDLFTIFVDYQSYKHKNLSSNENSLDTISSYKYIFCDSVEMLSLSQLQILKPLFSSSITTVFGDCLAINSECRDYLKSQLKTTILTTSYVLKTKQIATLNILTSYFSYSNDSFFSNLSDSGDVKRVHCENYMDQITYIAHKLQNNSENVGIFCKTLNETAFVTKILRGYGFNVSSSISPLLYNPLFKEFQAYLDVINKPKEANASFFYLLSQLGLKEESLRSVSRKTSQFEQSFYVLLSSQKNYCSDKDDNLLIATWFSMLESLLQLKQSKLSLDEIIKQILEKSAFFEKAELHGEETLKQLSEFHTRFLKSLHKLECREFSSAITLLDCFSYSLVPVSQNSINVLPYSEYDNDYYDEVFLISLHEKNMLSSQNLFTLPSNLQDSNEELKLFLSKISSSKDSLYLLTSSVNDSGFPQKISSFLQPFTFEVESPSEDELTHLPFYSLSHTSFQEYQLIFYVKHKQFKKAKELLQILEQKNAPSNSLLSYFSPYTSHNFSNQIYSISQLKTYQQCPQKYLYQYIYKIPTPSQPFFDFGTSLHLVVEQLQPLIQKQHLSKEKLVLRGLQLLTQNWISKSYTSSQQEQEYFELGTQSINSFVDKELSISHDKRSTIELEKKFFYKLNGKTLMGFIDRIDEDENGLILYDYKTSQSKESRDSLQEHLQLYTYALALQDDASYTSKPNRMALWYLVHDQIDSVSFDTSKAENVKKTILSTIESIEKKEFRATPSTTTCSFCPFKSICPFSKS